MDMVVCSQCETENRPGRRFCRTCGSALERPCEVCGFTNEPEDAFCGECGTRLATMGTLAAPSLQGLSVEERVEDSVDASGAQMATTELRHVSVLFCDLVGFTPLAESADPEEVRELLSGYFDLAKSVVAKYGGVIEKFIGDAVMALWEAPIANEDDAERAVRAGLELLAAVSNYGHGRGSALEARVGIVTGAAATSETTHQGMVVGDRVNTAARIQSVAPPGCCYVDEATRHATAASIAYQDAGVHSLKGKAEPAHLYQALRVVAGVGGVLKSEGLEAPFVGRDRELRLVKDLFHASAQERRAHLVSVYLVSGSTTSGILARTVGNSGRHLTSWCTASLDR